MHKAACEEDALPLRGSPTRFASYRRQLALYSVHVCSYPSWHLAPLPCLPIYPSAVVSVVSVANNLTGIRLGRHNIRPRLRPLTRGTPFLPFVVRKKTKHRLSPYLFDPLQILASIIVSRHGGPISLLLRDGEEIACLRHCTHFCSQCHYLLRRRYLNTQCHSICYPRGPDTTRVFNPFPSPQSTQLSIQQRLARSTRLRSDHNHHLHREERSRHEDRQR